MNLNWIRTAYPIKPKPTISDILREALKPLDIDDQERMDERIRRWQDMRDNRWFEETQRPRTPTPGYIWKQVPLPPIIATL